MHRRHGGCIVHLVSSVEMQEINIERFIDESEIGEAEELRLRSQLIAISESQQALIRIRPLTLANHFITPFRDPIDVNIVNALLSFEDRYENHYFNLSKQNVTTKPEFIIVIAGTPRTGNSITRKVIGAMGFAQYAVHSLNDLNFDALESRSVIQCHVDSRRLIELKSVYNLKVVTLVRDPLDVLESMRKYIFKNPESKYWGFSKQLAEIKKLEKQKKFYRWAIGHEIRRLLMLSLDVIKNIDTEVIRYENLVRQPKQTFDQIADALGVSRLIDVEQTLLELTKEFPPSHITHGGPGAGKEIGRLQTWILKIVYRRLFRSLGY
jgi:hypothetical protein